MSLALLGARGLEILLVLVLLIGVPLLVLSILAGAAAYVREGAERELEAMAEAGELAEPDDPTAPAASTDRDVREGPDPSAVPEGTDPAAADDRESTDREDSDS